MNDGSDMSEGRDDNALLKVFREFDLNNTGNMDSHELGALVYKLGVVLSAKERDAVIASLDTDGSGLLDYDEFLRWWLSQDRLRLVSLNDAEVEHPVGLIDSPN